jgi:peptidoglycan hydrolase CwlO-like protein|tara:strand:+ start:27 stop:305 length:279 start_codon:yes stop_codon:yes gene_type:complete
MIINWIKSLFHKTPDEILKLKEVIDEVNREKDQIQKDLDRLLARKIPKANKKTIANAKRKLTRTKNEIKKMTEVFDKEDIDDAVKFLRKFSK